MRNQIVYTKDNISVDIDTTLFYRIVDAYKATYIVKDILRSVTEMTYVTMRTICGEYVPQTLSRCSKICSSSESKSTTK